MNNFHGLSDDGRMQTGRTYNLLRLGNVKILDQSLCGTVTPELHIRFGTVNNIMKAVKGVVNL